MRTIRYIVNARIPTEKAHGYQISRVCSELARQGADVELWIPNRRNPIQKDVFEYYNTLERTFTVRKISCIDFFRFESVLGKIHLFFPGNKFCSNLAVAKGRRRARLYTRAILKSLGS
jgi:hypothetical protein